MELGLGIVIGGIYYEIVFCGKLVVLVIVLGLIVFARWGVALIDVLLIRSGVRIGDCALVGKGGGVYVGYLVVGVYLAWLWFVGLEIPVLYLLDIVVSRMCL